MNNVIKGNFGQGTPAGGLTPQDFRDSINRFRTQSLFMEYNPRQEKFPAYFTLADHDRNGFVSVRRIYLELCDPTEFLVGQTLLGDFRHWQALLERPWFRDKVDQWRVELDNKLESEALQALRETVRDPKSASRITAAKAILEKPWRSKQSTRGRPSKEELEGYRKKAAEDTAELDNDFERIFGPLVPNRDTKPQ